MVEAENLHAWYLDIPYDFLCKMGWLWRENLCCSRGCPCKSKWSKSNSLFWKRLFQKKIQYCPKCLTTRPMLWECYCCVNTSNLQIWKRPTDWLKYLWNAHSYRLHLQETLMAVWKRALRCGYPKSRSRNTRAPLSILAYYTNELLIPA